MSRLGEIVAPRRLGSGFRWLMASSWTSNLGDGIALAAGPLLVASLTSDAFLVALAATLQWLPPLLLGPLAGVASDRLDRRLLVVGVDTARTAVLLALTVVVATGHATITLVLAVLFAVGVAEVFADNTTSTLLPMLVHRDDLAVANSRLQTGFITVNQLAGPPLGAALFAAGTALPFGTQALAVGLGAVLVSKIGVHGRPREVPAGRRIRHDVAEGFVWVARHPAVRTLVITIFIFNITFGAAWSVLVLYATRHLGMGAVGYGLLTTMSAAGGLVGTAFYGTITRHVSLGNIMRIGLVIETLTHLGLALTSTPWVALVIMTVFGAHAFVWGATSTTIRQRAVPRELQGRAGSVNLVGVYGGLVLGSLVGGALAQHWGVTAPFWFAFVGSAVFVVAIWHQLRHLDGA
ncbi:MFS transporter [Cellulomonas citrea]|uniref:MFS transporter n=1 Tax=Cellulomonas citrea TaxID=1909423 RepID=UPI001F2EB106|nr:MFS transporter [Cellulomonas citrea]